jgi:hypothetical protein
VNVYVSPLWPIGRLVALKLPSTLMQTVSTGKSTETLSSGGIERTDEPDCRVDNTEVTPDQAVGLTWEGNRVRLTPPKTNAETSARVTAMII